MTTYEIPKWMDQDPADLVKKLGGKDVVLNFSDKELFPPGKNLRAYL